MAVTETTVHLRFLQRSGLPPQALYCPWWRPPQLQALAEVAAAPATVVWTTFPMSLFPASRELCRDCREDLRAGAVPPSLRSRPRGWESWRPLSGPNATSSLGCLVLVRLRWSGNGVFLDPTLVHLAPPPLSSEATINRRRVYRGWG